MLSENKISKYLLYAIGEIVLVVIGILIAIQINDWNRSRQLHQEELDSYQLIIADLKRDSVLFAQYKGFYTAYMDTYFEMNKISKGQGAFKNIMPDFIVSNIEFNPVTQNNHQATIEKLRNASIRDRINNYFMRLSRVHQARDEFNRLIERESRPYFLREMDVFKNEVIFDYSDRTFPPQKRVSGLDTVKLKNIISLPQSIALLSTLRMGMGFYMMNLDRSILENNELIRELEKNVD